MAVLLRSLALTGFRSLEPLTWSPAPGSHLLLGGTGAGKTSLLEAIYVVATTRSFRVRTVGDCLAHRLAARADGAFHLEAEVETPGRVRLEVGLSVAEGAWRRVNGKETTFAEHLAQLPVLAWTSAETEILVGGPDRRRRFLDRGLVGREPRSLDALARYRRILGHKRHLLARRQGGLEAWNEMLAEAAVEVVRRRAELVEALGVALAEALDASGLPFPPVELVYEPSPEEALVRPEETQSALGRLEREERDRRRPLAGPHLDRLHVRFGGLDLDRVASAGERKSVGLLLAASLARVWRQAGRDPILLLDDADAEIDRPTLERLFSVLRGKAQTLFTSNRPEVWEGLEVSHRWRLERGSLEAL